MCEEGCVCRIKAGGGCLRLGGNCLEYLERGRNKKRGEGKQRFLKTGASWIKGRVLEKRGG